MSIDPRSYTYANDVLRDRIILVTGSSDGIGKALALHIAGLGAQVILHGRSVQKLEKIYDAIEAIDGAPRPSIAVMDLESANAESYTTLAQSIESEFGRLDGLVLNASILGERYSIEQYDAVLWQKVMHVNVTSVFAMTQVFLPLLQNSDDPSVIFTSSGVGRTGKAFWERMLRRNLRPKVCPRYWQTNIGTASCAQTVLTPVPHARICDSLLIPPRIVTC